MNFESNNEMVLNDFLSADGFFGEAYRTMNNPGQDDFMDEQLQMALRISLEEEKKRIEEMEKRKLEQAGEQGARAPAGEAEPQQRTDFLEKAEELALNPEKKGAGGAEKEELDFVPDAEFLEDLKKELGIPEEELIKTQLDNPNKIQEEGQPPEGQEEEKEGADKKDEGEQIREESQEPPKDK